MILDFGPPPARERYVPNDIGPSPETWLAPRLEQISTLITNGFVGTATPFYTDHTGVKYLYGQNVRQNYVDENGIRYITKSFHDDQSKTRLRTGDILTVQSGHIGVTAVVPPSLDGANCHALIVTRLRKQYANPDFVSQYLNSEIGKARLRGLEVGSTILHINTKDLKKFRIPLPALAEQERIVELLKTWDRAIETVEALIANARAQKQALMQQLLPQGTTPPKKRLPGFSGKWRKLHIGDVAKEVSERAGEQTGYLVLSCSKYDGMVESLSYFKKKVYSDDTSNYKVMRRGTFGFPSNHVEEGSIGYQDLCDAGIVSPIYCVFATSNEVDDGFLYKLLKTDRYRQIFAAATNASVDRRGSLRWKEFSRISLPLPPLEEQRAISDAVDAVAATETAYQTQLAALRQEKAALMQQLLTGKRRVKLPESEAA